MLEPARTLAPGEPVRAAADLDRRRRILAAWLAGAFLLIAAMVGLGGATRLTGSGLSMVEWRPLIGVLPPGSDAEWERVFDLYRRSPQFQITNPWMDLEAFRSIFWLEYLHRACGRFIGLFVALPWAFFLARGWMSRPLAVRTGSLLVLGAAQGGLGWFMVRSGLVDVPEVSHMRLAAHLMLAFFVATWVAWTFLDLVGPRARQRPPAVFSRLAWGMVGLVAVQCIYGAFMAGTRAGWLFSTFPDLNGSLSPVPFLSRSSVLEDLLETPAVIHWVHRALAWATLGYAGLIAYAAVRYRVDPILRGTVRLVVSLVGAQFGLGLATVVLSVPLPIAVAHQLGALATLTAAVVLAWQAVPRPPARLKPRRTAP